MAEISFQISPAPGITNDLIAVIYKTTAPTAEIDRIVKNQPHSSPFNFQFSNLADGVYIVKIHESPDGVTLGNLRHDWWEDATTGQILFERKFYTVDGGGTYDPLSTASPVTIADPYFAGKTITGVFQEGYRYLKPTTEWSQVSGGAVEFDAAISNEPGQVWSVEISYLVPANSGAPQAPFSDIVVVTSDITLNTTHYNKSIYARASGNKITITSPSIGSIPEGTGFKIFHDGGNAINTIFQLPSGQIVRFLGEDRNNIILAKGEFIEVIKKVISGTDYLFVTDHDGQWLRVGEIIEGRKGVSNGIFSDGTEYDLNVYVRLAEYINSLPSSQIVDYATFETTQLFGTQSSYTKKGFFAVDPVNNKCKVPDLRNLSPRWLKDVAGPDPSRVDSLPGGYQHHQVGEFDFSGTIMQKSGTANRHVVLENINDANLGNQGVTFNAGDETRGRNIGFIPIMLI